MGQGSYNIRAFSGYAVRYARRQSSLATASLDNVGAPVSSCAPLRNRLSEKQTLCNFTSVAPNGTLDLCHTLCYAVAGVWRGLVEDAAYEDAPS